jgi:hypothetical protein
MLGIQNKLSSWISNNANVNGSNWKIEVERSKLKKAHEFPLDYANHSLILIE